MKRKSDWDSVKGKVILSDLLSQLDDIPDDVVSGHAPTLDSSKCSRAETGEDG